jgi:hypothetical protein
VYGVISHEPQFRYFFFKEMKLEPVIWENGRRTGNYSSIY